jgi:hypothetical protein
MGLLICWLNCNQRTGSLRRAFFISAQTETEGRSRAKPTVADQATALAALHAQPRVNFGGLTMDIPAHAKSDALALAVCIVAILIGVVSRII